MFCTLGTVISYPILIIAICANSMRILQISDVHLDVKYSTVGDPSNMCHVIPGKKFNIGEFGDYQCDTPKSLLRHMVKAVVKVIPDPDLILLTGDFVPHIKNYNQSYVKGAVQIVTGMIDSAYPNRKVLPIFGNHDGFPSDYFPSQNCTICEIIYPIWKHWIGDSNKDTFTKAGYYKYVLDVNTIILSLNTNLYYRFNGAVKDFRDPDDPAGQFQFMIDTLTNAKRSKQIVCVIAHIAPGMFERTLFFSWMLPKYNERFINISLEYADTIGWMIFGHHHSDTFHIVKDPINKKAKQVYFISPSVTPWFSDLPGAGSVNPSFRIFDYNETIHQLDDIVTFSVNLKELNEDQSKANWTREYSMKDAYNLETINAETMNSILERLKQNDTSTWMKYIQYNSVGWDPKMPTGDYRKAQICSIEFPDYGDYKACMPKQTNGASRNMAIMLNHFNILSMSIASLLNAFSYIEH